MLQVPGQNAPLISNTEGAVARDFSTYLVPVGAADIFFPTNFDALASLYVVCPFYSLSLSLPLFVILSKK